ncbi:MAG TPA: hypothetical protein VM100_13810 [Longimicrobiales bacterium]|nr:hypothetical protein [Longimicrobiales bacterium]
MKRRRWPLLLLLVLLKTAAAYGQQQEETDPRAARRAVGLRAGSWQDLPYAEIYFQRGLAERVALENSLGVWRRKQGTWTTYVIPLLTTVKFYPLTAPARALQPYVMVGLGLGVGVESESKQAVGGGGTSILTALGGKAAGGLEFKLRKSLHAHGGARYLYMHYNDKLAFRNTYDGIGFEGGISYRFSF